ncbi:MAG: metallophosphoesterase [Candidatus Woesearchaeota archaeon]
MKIISIADLHYGEPHKDILRNIFKSHTVLEDLEKLFIQLQNEKEKTDLVIFLGDQIYRKTKEKDTKHIQELKDLLKKYNLNSILLIGNHEIYNFTKEEIINLYDLENNYFEKIIDNNQLIFLDVINQIVLNQEQKENLEKSQNKKVQYDYTINIDKKQISWLKQKLKQSKNYKSTLIFSHAPLNYFDISKTPWFKGWKDKINIAEHKQVLEILKKQNKRIYCFNGHVHKNKQTQDENIKLISLDAFSRFLEESKNCFIKPQYLEININDEVDFKYKEVK